MKPGNGSKRNEYKEEYIHKLPMMFANGESLSEVCAELGISKQTFDGWCEKYPEFEDAFLVGLQAAEAWWQKLGRGSAAGKLKIHLDTYIFVMKNRFKWENKEKLMKNPLDTSSVNITQKNNIEAVKQSEAIVDPNKKIKSVFPPIWG